MLFAGMMALAGAAVVDHARSARRQSKGSGTGAKGGGAYNCRGANNCKGVNNCRGLTEKLGV